MTDPSAGQDMAERPSDPSTEIRLHDDAKAGGGSLADGRNGTGISAGLPMAVHK